MPFKVPLVIIGFRHEILQQNGGLIALKCTVVACILGIHTHSLILQKSSGKHTMAILLPGHIPCAIVSSVLHKAYQGPNCGEIEFLDYITKSAPSTPMNTGL